MTAANVTCIPGYHGSDQSPSLLASEADKIGYPILLKAVKGGGGKGMRIARSPEDFQSALESAKSEARNSFGDDAMLVEKYITTPRHIEVQIFADKHGNCVALGERDCSIQRRHQKILEESPAPHLEETVRQELWQKACAAALAVKYEGAGTVEFIFDNDSGKFFFMEMNTRLQVEHPVTEMVTGEDLVRWQIIVAEGGRLPLTQAQILERIRSRGHAIEARIYAENPALGFIPDSGRLIHVRTPNLSEEVRIDAGFIEGDEVSSHYDPMISKLIVKGLSREVAIAKLEQALGAYEIVGPATNLDFLKRVCGNETFRRGEVETGFIEKQKEDLFKERPTPPEVFAQAAIAMMLETHGSVSAFGTTPLQMGFMPNPGTRVFRFAVPGPSAIEGGTAETSSFAEVTLKSNSPNTFSVEVLSHNPPAEDSTVMTQKTSPTTSSYPNVTSTLDLPSRTLTSHFPHTILSTRYVPHPTLPTSNPTIPTPTPITLFHHSTSYTLHPIPTPSLLSAFSIPSSSSSSSSPSLSSTPPLLTGTSNAQAEAGADAVRLITTPMPCKILHLHVTEGQVVEAGDKLVTIESMKMETVLRFGIGTGINGKGTNGKKQRGRVKRTRVKEGDVLGKGGVCLEVERLT